MQHLRFQNMLVAACIISSIGCHAVLPVTLTSAASGRLVELRRSQELVIRLEANPSTGYHWEIAESAPTALKQLGEGQYEPASVPTGRVGGGGMMTWRFRAVRTASDTLRFVYRRPWEKDSRPAQTFIYTIIVR